MTAFPIVETERLVLRPYAAGDLPDCAALWGDPATVAFIGKGQPLSLEEAWSRVLRYIGHWHALGYGYWAVRERSSGRFVGDVGFQNGHRAIEPGLGDRPEIGWVLAAHAQGRGLAHEAVAGALAWADAHLGARETVCIIGPAHERSIRVARGPAIAGPDRPGMAPPPSTSSCGPGPFNRRPPSLRLDVPALLAETRRHAEGSPAGRG